MTWTPASGWATGLLIDGREVCGDGAPLTVENPATGESILNLRQASVAQVDDAVRAARRAFDSDIWSDGRFRQQVLNRIADLMEENGDDLTGALVEEVGTPVNLVKSIQLGTPIGLFRYFASLAAADRTRYLGPDGNAAMPSESIVRYLPVGVVAQVAAYNYPLLLLALKLAPALAAGCTSVLLPSPQTPLSTLMVGRLLREAGVPAGVCNILVGGVDVGQALTEHPQVDKVAFTGSVAVGRAVMQQAANTIKGVVLELGGKSAAILLPDADLDAVTGPCHLRYLRHAGQGCASPTRILVHESRYRDFVERSAAFLPTVRVGDPWNMETVVGPLISEAHRNRVEAYVARAQDAGAKIVAGGGRPSLDRGWYMNPTLVGELDNSFEIAREELFGPVGVVLPYRDLDEAVTIANDSTLGLAGAVYGPGDAALEVARRLRVGTVYINGGGAIRMDAPMGGFKQSGIGREYGEEGLSEYLEPQHLQWSTVT